MVEGKVTAGGVGQPTGGYTVAARWLGCWWGKHCIDYSATGRSCFSRMPRRIYLRVPGGRSQCEKGEVAKG